jgi:ABC-type lipoprotein release transport system permease subunit
MMDLIMAWRNIFRNIRRTTLTVLAIAFACLLLVFMLSFQFGSYETMIDISVSVSTGHLQIQARGYKDDQDIRQAMDETAVLSAVLDDRPDIRAFSFRAGAFALVSSATRSEGILITGIEPDREKNVSTVTSLVRSGAYLSDQTPYGALIGHRLARNLGIGVGEELTVLGQGRDGSVAAAVFSVSGIFESGIDAVDRNTLMIRLSDFQDTFFMDGGIHQAVILLDRLGSVAPVKQALSEALSGYPDLLVLDWMELTPGLLQSIQMDLVGGGIMYLILIIVVAFSIFNTFLMAIFERTREFGVMTALGVSPFRLMKLVLMESMAMTLLGLILGMTLGIVVTLFFQHHGIAIPGTEEIFRQYGLPDRFYPRLTPITVFAGPLVVFVITVLSAIIPALKLRGLKPVEAMTHV